MTKLTDSSLLTTGSFEKDRQDSFYYGEDGSGHYLVEHMSSNWKNCAWNGKHSLLAFVPIKSNTKYYFHFKAYTLSGKASVRFGSVNMDSYVPENYTTQGSLNFSGSGYFDCTNGDMQNVGGAWTEYETVIDSADGDYFLFNAYWLQMAEYLCIGDFELYELADKPLESISEIKKPAPLLLPTASAVQLKEAVIAETNDGTTVTLPVTWLNAEAVDTAHPNVYIVTGLLNLPVEFYYSGSLYVKQRVTVTDYLAEITDYSTDGSDIYCSLTSIVPVCGTLYIAGYDENGALSELKSREISLGNSEILEISEHFSQEYKSVKIFFWNISLAKPLSLKKSM